MRMVVSRDDDDEVNDQYHSDCRRPGSGWSSAPIGGASCPTTAAAADEALRRNHDGVTMLMSGGQDTKAIAVLRLGLEHMKSEISSGACPSCTTTSTESSSFSSSSSVPFRPSVPPFLEDDQQQEQRPPSSSCPPRPFRPNPPPGVSSLTSNYLLAKMTPIPVYESRRYCANDDVFVYTNAFTFHQDHHGDDRTTRTIITRTMLANAIEEEDNEEESQEEVQQGRCNNNFSQMITSEILSATIIYNLALAFHMRAIREGSLQDDTSKCSNIKNTQLHAARRALALYDKCIKFLNLVINPAAVSSSASSCSFQGEDKDKQVLCSSITARTISIPALCLAIACRNNMAHLVYILGDFEQWPTVTSSLKSLLCIYYSSLEISDFVTPFLDSDLDGFKWNSIVVTLPITAKAA